MTEASIRKCRHTSEKAHNKLSFHAISIHYTIWTVDVCVCAPGEALHVDVISLTTRGIKTNCKVLSSSFKMTNSLGMLQKVRDIVNLHTS